MLAPTLPKDRDMELMLIAAISELSTTAEWKHWVMEDIWEYVRTKAANIE